MISKLEPYGDVIADISPRYAFPFTESIIQMSPSLPMNFDRSLIPENICEEQFLYLNRCIQRFGISETKPNSCGNYIFRFKDCKIRRDTILYDRIKTWETEQFQGLSSQNKQLYMQGLQFKLQRLKEQFQTLPSLSTTQFLQKRINHEQVEVRWRMRYLEKLN